MLRRLLFGLGVVLLASGILFTSIARTAQVRYSFRAPAAPEEGEVLGESTFIDYKLPYPGRVLPDHPLWPIKVLRDRLWLFVSPSVEKKAELNLLFADKRMVSAKMLFEREKAELAFSTATKAEKYLEKSFEMERKAKERGVDTSEFLQRYAKAALKHRELIEEMMVIAPEDAKPMLIDVAEKYPQRLYERSRDALYEQGITPPENPFTTQ